MGRYCITLGTRSCGTSYANLLAELYTAVRYVESEHWPSSLFMVV